jgi:hypothetical protein
MSLQEAGGKKIEETPGLKKDKKKILKQELQ